MIKTGPTSKLLSRCSSHQILSSHVQTSIPQRRPEDITPYSFGGNITELRRSVPFCRIGVLKTQSVDEVLGGSWILREIDVRDTEVESEYK